MLTKRAFSRTNPSTSSKPVQNSKELWYRPVPACEFGQDMLFEDDLGPKLLQARNKRSQEYWCHYLTFTL
jgi:hypothetical protein